MKHNVIKALLPLLVPISELHLDSANTREGHDINGISNSLVEFGQRTPLVANESGRILKGNGTFKSARGLGWTHIAALRVDDSDVTAARYSIADNLLGDKSRFSSEALQAVLDSMDEPESIPGADEDWLELVKGALPDENEWGEAFGGLPDGDKAPFMQMTFTLHDSQVDPVKEALGIAKGLGDFDSQNENSNGNALARICETFITQNGQS